MRVAEIRQKLEDSRPPRPRRGTLKDENKAFQEPLINTTEPELVSKSF